jgi:hypothetical protein
VKRPTMRFKTWHLQCLFNLLQIQCVGGVQTMSATRRLNKMRAHEAAQEPVLS